MIAFPHKTVSDSESEEGSDIVVVVAVVVAVITLIVVLLVGGFLTIHLFRKKNPIRLSPVSVAPNTRCGVHAEGNISSTYHAVVVSPNEAYGAIDKHEQVITGNHEDNCVEIEDDPPLDVSPNMAYSPHENVSPRNALANAIAINPNEAYGVPAEVNISSTNHSTDAAIVVKSNEAYGAIDTHEEAPAGNRERNCVAMETSCEYY